MALPYNIQTSYNQAAEQNRKATQKYLKQLEALYKKQLANYKKQIATEKKKVPSKYVADYDLNAINQLINERKLSEKMASMGLTSSGSNLTAQTGINLARQNADGAVTLRKQKDLSALDKSLQDYRSKLNTEKASKKADALKELEDKNSDLLESLIKTYTSASTKKSTKNSSSNNANLLQIYNKLLSIDSPTTQALYINLILDDGVINKKQAQRLRKRFGLN